ncbi:hypothetical protein [Thorsellia anophelis]|uniref:HEPN domain-containing protein n=1 Tax=Thorsellia anophelis DSM 18579 TaxID=1123402 RepID=A0A1I0D753_9GAMM|nr:hypothetical protein [Thorsellia anophelis]SET28085.1 hypothetical protein SAMN02583745_01879 [Thorsellia anophelis DSM 18579]
MSAQINYLSFLDFATSIIGLNNSEIYNRNVVSRSYYAMYHCILNEFGPFKKIPKKGVHQQLAINLSRLNVKEADEKKLKRLLYTLENERNKRIIADYKLDSQLNELDAKQSIATANKFISKVKSIKDNIQEN